MNDWKSERCKKIHPFTEALKKLAVEENVVLVDQYPVTLTNPRQALALGHQLERSKAHAEALGCLLGG